MVAKPNTKKPPEIFVSLAKVYSAPFTPLTANLGTFMEMFSCINDIDGKNSKLLH